VIRAVALGMGCLVALGVVATSAKRPVTEAEPQILYPTVAANKSDRLPRAGEQDTLASSDTQIVYPMPDLSNATLVVATKETPKTQSSFIPRHWHDPHDSQVKVLRSKDRKTKQTQKLSSVVTPTQFANVESCHSNGMDMLLRKLKLSPPCN
jgi:hypothetical protein